MSTPKEAAEDAIAAEEMAGTAAHKRPLSPGDQPSSSQITKAPRNAFTALMSPQNLEKGRRPPPANTDTATAASNASFGRDALAQYVLSPQSFPASRVISQDTNFVVIRDLYPKSSVHILLLPRDPEKMRLHPFDALNGSDAAFLESVKAETSRLKGIVASELRRKFGRESVSEKPRLEAMDRGEIELPPGRDWSHDVLAGVHAHPSMSHLHIHILSRDRHSACLKHAKHYNSFSTPFLVPVVDFPLTKDDERRHPGKAGYLARDLICWKCGMNFGNKFKRLKEHLHEEFEAWKTE